MTADTKGTKPYQEGLLMIIMSQFLCLAKLQFQKIVNWDGRFLGQKTRGVSPYEDNKVANMTPKKETIAISHNRTLYWRNIRISIHRPNHIQMAYYL